MENFARRETRSSETSPDVDFSDVFGGPPRRFSNQEGKTRYSFSEAESDAALLPRNPWSLSDEKPVFGAETVTGRAHDGDGFYDDIFQGGESKSFGSPTRSFNRTLSSSVPIKFSFPANVTKTTDHPSLGSAKISRGISDVVTTELQEDMRYDPPLYRKSPLSQEASDINQESTKLDEENMETELKCSEREVEISAGQFHFSIYKWPGSGVPSLMALAGGSKSRFRDRLRAERCASSNVRVEGESNGMHSPIFSEPESVSLNVDSAKEKTAESGSEHVKISETKVSASEGNDTAVVSKKKTEEGSHSKHKRDKKRAHAKKGKPLMSEEKPLHVLLNDNDYQKQGKDIEGKITNTANVSTTKKNDAKRAPSIQKPENHSGDAFGGSRVKGKVGDFVKLFDRDKSEMIKNVFRSHSTRWKQVNANAKDDGVSNAVKTDEKTHKMPESSSKEDGVFNKNKVKQEPYSKKSSRKTSGLYTNEKNAPLMSESRPKDYGVEVEDRDECFPGFFSVEEVPQVEENVSEISEESEHIQTSNAKIQQWSSGRKGNIRSLLSTLQFVLWPESGWKPVPLVDLIEGSTVKRAYQRALLCLHPDKLQQKGAAPHQKYLAQQVFDILQEAWDLFNTLGAT